MNEELCALCGSALCGSAVGPTADRCVCGASVDWLRRAPAALRAKLGGARRGMAGAIVGTMVTSCGACAAIDVDGGSSDGGVDAYRAVDAGVGPIGDGGCASDCGLDAYRMPDAPDTADTDVADTANDDAT